MGYVAVSNCPKCGAPLYVESPWMSILPPPTIRSCSCFSDVLQQSIMTIATSSGGTWSHIVTPQPIKQEEEPQ